MGYPIAILSGNQQSYALDQLSVKPVVAYSLRQLSAAYIGKAINVRRSSDNAAKDIGFINGTLDITSLLAFCGANSGYITTWYNQGSIGSTGNLVQATAISQPKIVTAGALNVAGGVPAALFSGAQYMSTVGNVGPTGANPSSEAFLGNFSSQTESSATFYYAGQNVSGYGRSLGQLTPGQWGYGFPINASFGTNETLTSPFVGWGIANGTAQQLFFNGNLIATNSGVISTTASPISVGGNGTYFASGNLIELLDFASIISATDRSSYNRNAAIFAGISGVMQ